MAPSQKSPLPSATIEYTFQAVFFLNFQAIVLKKNMQNCFLFLVLLLFFLTIRAQDTGTHKISTRADSARQLDSQVIRIQTVQDSFNRVLMNKDLDAFVRMQKQREKEQREQMYIRIALGIFFFILLVVGLTRKRRK